MTTVFSPKGGVGKSVTAVNLATALARTSGEPVVVLDLDLQFGDIAVMLDCSPCIPSPTHFRPGRILTKPSCAASWPATTRAGLDPGRPYIAFGSRPGGLGRHAPRTGHTAGYVRSCRRRYPASLSEVVLQAVAESDLVCFVVEMDVPSVKNARLGLQAFELLQLPLAR